MEISNPNIKSPREKILWAALIPQIILLTISILWVYLFPKDNVFPYLKFNPGATFIGILTGIGLAISGYGFYNLSKKIKKLSDIVELFEKVLAPVFSQLKIVDYVLLSLVSGFIEEIFFRGLLLPKIGIILSSIAFGLLHLPGRRFWIYTLWATISGALFGVLFLLSGSLWLPISGHVTNNLIGMFLLKKLKK